MKVLVYFHDMMLPHSAFLREAAGAIPGAESCRLLAPRERTGVSAVFTAGGDDQPAEARPAVTRVDTYGLRETWVRLGEWRRILRKFRPDAILVLDEALSVNALLAGLAARLEGVAAPVLFYGFENIVQAVGWKTFRAEPSPRHLWAILRKSARWLLMDQALMPLRRRLVHGGLVSYPECAEVVRAYSWNPPMRQHWWPVNLEAFTPEGPRADPGLGGRKIVGFAGRFVPEKGLDDLIDAVAHLDDGHGLVLIGDGPEKAALERRVAALGLAERTRFVPPQPQKDLAAWYRAMDVFALPSRTREAWKEQFGRVLIEAMACGTPAVGSDSGAIPFVIADPSRVFPEGDSQALAAVLRRVCAEGSRITDSARFQQCHPDAFFGAYMDLARTVRGEAPQGV